MPLTEVSIPRDWTLLQPGDSLTLRNAAGQSVRLRLGACDRVTSSAHTARSRTWGADGEKWRWGCPVAADLPPHSRSYGAKSRWR